MSHETIRKDDFFSATQGCNIVATLLGIATTLIVPTLQRCVTRKIVVANRLV